MNLLQDHAKLRRRCRDYIGRALSLRRGNLKDFRLRQDFYTRPPPQVRPALTSLVLHVKNLHLMQIFHMETATIIRQKILSAADFLLRRR